MSLAEKPVTLIPEIFDRNYTPDSEVYTLRYDLPVPVRSLDWNGDMLAYGHKNGIHVLTPIPKGAPLAKNLPSKFQQDWVFQSSTIGVKSPVIDLRFTSKYIVTTHEDCSIQVLNHLDGSQVILGGDGIRGHSKDVTNIDVSDNGLIASASYDRTVQVWEDGQAKVIPTRGIPTLVKFWMDKDSDKLIVVENGDVIRVLDWRNSEWLFTIYPKSYSKTGTSFIQDIFISNGKIVVISNGSWKEYDPEELRGGAGYTFTNNEGQLTGWISNARYLSSHSRPYLGGISQDRSSFYDLNNGLDQVHQFKLQLPSTNVPAGSINQNGIAAIVSGAKLILARPFDSYEAIQY